MNNENKLASFCLFTYNQENYIEEALKGAFSQTYPNLEIIISDDASTDGTQDIIRRMVNDYRGPHKLVLNFNDENLGLTRHVNKILYEICSGEYIFLAAGDDKSLPSRVDKTVAFYSANPNVVATGSNLQEINDSSMEANTQNYRLKEQAVYDLGYYLSPAYEHLYGCTRTFSRDLVKAFPPLHSSCPTEDTPLLLRAFLLNKNVAFMDEVMVHYRIHGNNISAPANIIKMNVNHIFAQYERDVVFARKKNYISRREYLAIRKVLKVRKDLRLQREKPLDRIKRKIYKRIQDIFNRKR